MDKKTISSKVVILGTFAIITFILGLLLGSSLVFASIPIILYLSLVLLQAEDPHSNVKVTRLLERSQVDEGETCRVKLTVTNLEKTIPLLNIEDAIPVELRDPEQTRASFTLSLDSGETEDLFYLIRGNVFGVFSLGPITVKSNDSFGFAEIEDKIDSRSSMVVLPSTPEKLLRFKIKPRKTKPWPGEILARRVGLGMDNFSIRQYVPGDSFRRVNWKASAKGSQDQLLLNEQMAELGTDTIVIVDARPVSQIGSVGDSTVTSSVHAAISITDKLLRDRNRVGLITVGQNSERIPPGYGRRQFNRLVLSLIKVRPGEFFTFDNISRYMRFFYPNLAQVVLVSSLVDEEAFEAASEIIRSGYELIVVSPNPLDFSTVKEKEKSTRTWKVSRDLAEIIRNANLNELRKVHSLVVDWRKGEPLDQALSKNMRAWNRQAELGGRRIRN